MRAVAAGRLQREVAAHQARKATRDEQAETRAAAAGIARRLFEGREDRLGDGVGNARAGVDDADQDFDAAVAQVRAWTGWP